CIGGQGLALGYLNQPELTAQAFIEHPLKPGQRLYRSGDLGRWREDGTLEFMGRRDQQVKLRGFRVEPGEVQSRLQEHPAVAQAVVVVDQTEAGDKRLVAYYTLSDAATPLPPRDLREYMDAELPDYMVPSAFVWLPQLPITLNGKLDRKALPPPDDDAFHAERYVAPEGAIEAELAAIWSELLGRPLVGRHDNFFELGGHSLLTLRLLERMRQASLSADASTLFQSPTLARFAAGTKRIREIVL
ncbi:non-ribosomal peptide synthetase, partial [Roseateles sp. DB2]|uniref:acyl carrier protein n=1 Tax=Roseateles sp. DB2 TaxID=3453717 RepID=UPI003EEC8A8F